MSKLSIKQKFETITSAELFEYLKWIFIFASLAIAITFIFYFFNFHGDFSISKQDLGIFGDYIGGTLNPVLSFLSLIALLVTIFLQSNELELTRIELIKTAKAAQNQVSHFQNESKRSDVYRLIEKLVSRIDSRNKDIHLFNGQRLIYMANKSFRSDDFAENLKELLRLYEDKSSVVFDTIQGIETDFELLLYYLKKYEATSDGRYLLEFYRAEFGYLILFLCEHGFLLNENLYHDFFYS